MKLINQTLLSLLTILIFGVSLFFSMSQASGQSEDKNKIQNEVRARLVFDVAKGFFIVENYKSAIDRLEEFSKLKKLTLLFLTLKIVDLLCVLNHIFLIQKKDKG